MKARISEVDSTVQSVIALLNPQNRYSLEQRFEEGFGRIEVIACALHDLRKQFPTLSCEHFRDARAQAQYAKTALENAYATHQAVDTTEEYDLIENYVDLAFVHVRLIRNHFLLIPAVQAALH